MDWMGRDELVIARALGLRGAGRVGRCRSEEAADSPHNKRALKKILRLKMGVEDYRRRTIPAGVFADALAKEREDDEEDGDGWTWKQVAAVAAGGGAHAANAAGRIERRMRMRRRRAALMDYLHQQVEAYNRDARADYAEDGAWMRSMGGTGG